MAVEHFPLRSPVTSYISFLPPPSMDAFLEILSESVERGLLEPARFFSILRAPRGPVRTPQSHLSGSVVLDRITFGATPPVL
jgi:hypothetical protein